MVATRTKASKKAWVARKRMISARGKALVAQASQATDSRPVDEPVKLDLTGDLTHRDALSSSD